MSLYPQFTLSGLRDPYAKERAAYHAIREHLETALALIPKDTSFAAAELKEAIEGTLHDAEAFIALDLIESDERKHVEMGVQLFDKRDEPDATAEALAALKARADSFPLAGPAHMGGAT